MVGALFPSMNGCDASRVQWESSLLSPDVKDASASLEGAPEGINTHESNSPELSFCESAVRQVLQPATCCPDPSGDPGADPLLHSLLTAPCYSHFHHCLNCHERPGKIVFPPDLPHGAPLVNMFAVGQGREGPGGLLYLPVLHLGKP